MPNLAKLWDEYENMVGLYDAVKDLPETTPYEKRYLRKQCSLILDEINDELARIQCEKKPHLCEDEEL